jgi:hypothetical protein
LEIRTSLIHQRQPDTSIVTDLVGRGKDEDGLGTMMPRRRPSR